MKHQNTILSELRKDAHKPLKTIARKAKLPVSTCFDHLKNIKQQGFIKRYTILPDWELLGLGVKAFVSIRAPRSSQQAIKDVLLKNQHLNGLWRCDDGFMAELVCPSIHAMEELLDLLESIPEARIHANYVIEEYAREARSCGR